MWKHLTVRSGREFLKHIVPAVLKPAQTLWNEVIGFVFFCLAVYCGSGIVRAYMKLASHAAELQSGAKPSTDGGDLFRLVLSTSGTLLMLYFAVSSFLRARRISRS